MVECWGVVHSLVHDGVHGGVHIAVHCLVKTTPMELSDDRLQQARRIYIEYHL